MVSKMSVCVDLDTVLEVATMLISALRSPARGDARRGTSGTASDTDSLHKIKKLILPRPMTQYSDRVTSFGAMRGVYV